MTRRPYYFIALTTYRGWGHADSTPSGFLEEQNIEFVYTQVQKRINKQKVLSYVERKNAANYPTWSGEIQAYLLKVACSGRCKTPPGRVACG